MERRVASIVLMLSLEALLFVAGLSAAAAGSGDMDIIRLPSDAKLGFSDKAMAMARARPGDEQRPWKCCDQQLCTRSWPPRCACHDIVEQCSDTCKTCVKEKGNSASPRYICRDWYEGRPAPRCHKDEENEIVHRGYEKVAVVTGAEKKKDQQRPWKCCDRAVTGPTTKGTVWYCMDKFQHCTCEHCLKVEGAQSYYCLDGYQGSSPGTSCTHA